MIEFFITPMIGTGTREDPIQPRYASDEFSGAFGLPDGFGAIRYSRDTVAILMLDAPQTYLDEVQAQPDADRLTTLGDINDNIGGQGNTFIRNLLESLNIPGQWTSAAQSWRSTMRVIIGMFLFAQRHEGQNQIGFFTDLEAAGFGLNTQWQDLSQDFQTSIQNNIDSWGWSIIPADVDQVRKLMKDFSDQLSGEEFFIGGVSI